MPDPSEKAPTFAESPIAAASLTVPAFAAWGLICAKSVVLPLDEAARIEDFLTAGFAATAFACAIAAGLYALVRAIRREAVGGAFPVGALCAGIAMLASTVVSIFTRGSGNASDALVALGSCVPPLAYSISLLASRSLRGRFAATGKDGFVPAAIAALWLVMGGAFISGRGFTIFVSSILPLFIGLFLASLLAFSFFAARLAHSRISRARRPIGPAARSLFSLALPLAGIGLCALMPQTSMFDGYLDFVLHPALIVLVILSGLSLCAPDLKPAPLRLAQACIRSALFCASAYIALVFLPLTPAIPFAAFFFGAGLLLALPTLNLICHFSAIRSDILFLRMRYRPIVLAAALVPSFLILPSIIAGRAFLDAANLKAALSWARGEKLREPACAIDTEALSRSLEDSARANSRVRTRRFPILSEARAALATGGERLSERSRDLLNSAFLGIEPSRDWNRGDVPADSPDFAIEASLESSVFDPGLGLQRSRVEIKPRYEGRQRLGEFRVGFRLPKAAWIRDYYLYVGSEKRGGLLFERRAASAAYEATLRKARDPGLLVISEENEASLRVFPFAEGEERRTGFEILHAEAFTLELGDARIDMPGIEAEEAGLAADWILPPPRLASLPAALRTPYLHVIVDASASALAERPALAKSVEAALRIPLPRSSSLPAKISFADFEERSRAGEGEWEAELDSLAGRGGFLPFRAIRSLAREAESEDRESFPVFVVARASPPLEWARKSAEEPVSASELPPECEAAYAIGPDGKLISIVAGRAEPAASIRFHPVARLESGGSERVVRTDEARFELGPASRGPLAELVRIRAEPAAPGRGEADRAARLVSSSKASGILCPSTAFLVLERDREYEAVARAEKAGSKGIAEETPVELGLPPLSIAAALAAGAFAFMAAGKLGRRRERPLGAPRSSPGAYFRSTR